MSKAVIVYDSRTGPTGKIAMAIQDGLKDSGIEVTLKKAAKAKTAELKDADAVVLGSPEYNGEVTAPMKTFLDEMDKADLRGKLGAAFGSYGWDGAAIEDMAETMTRVYGMESAVPTLKVPERQTDMAETKVFAKKIAERIQPGG
jgi:flavorubredoxin